MNPFRCAVAAVSLLAAGCSTRPDDSPVVSIEAVAENPEAYLGRTLQLTGMLENRGTNYFTDLDLVIHDERGHFVRVRPWLPLETAPGSQGSVLSQFLDRRVALAGVLVREPLRNVGATYLLEVEEATLVV
jgi:hypothetical protein